MTRIVVNAFFKKIFKNNRFPVFQAIPLFPCVQTFVLTHSREKIARFDEILFKVDHFYDRKTD